MKTAEFLTAESSELKQNEIKSDVENIIARVQDGYEDALKSYIVFSRLKKLFENAMVDILEDAIADFENYGEKTVELMECKISKTSSGRFDYSESTTWSNKKKELQEIEKVMKLAYQNAIKGINSVSANGEIMDIAIYKPSKSSLRIS